jgi:hypothetical protein
MFNIELTGYQSYLLYAYMISVICQIIVLYILSNYCDDRLVFITRYAIVYVIFSGLQFMCFLKLIEFVDHEN